MSSQLSASISLSKRLAAEPPTSTVGNVNIVEISDNNREPVCYLPFLFEFTNEYQPNNAIGQYEGLAAILLAMEHLNTGNGTIVPELDGIEQRCPLKFTTKAFDTGGQQRMGIDHAMALTDRNRSRTRKLLPSAILGAASSSVSIPTSIISGLRGFPQISPISTSSILDDKSQFKLFGRTIPNDDGTAVPLVEKLTSWNVDHIAVLHIDNTYGNAFATAICLEARRGNTPGLDVETVDIAPDADDRKISFAIQLLKETQFTYFFAVVLSDELVDRIMTEAYNQGIAGTGRHTWLFSDGIGTTVIDRDFPIGSPLERAYRGTGVFSAVGGIPGIDAYDKLTKSMQQLAENEEDRSYLDFHFPRDYPDGKIVDHSIITDQAAFLKTPGLIGPFLYDAVVGLGLASCALIEASENSGNFLEEEHDYFTGEVMFRTLLNTTFDGASGSIIFDPHTGTREPRTALFSLTNFVDDEDASRQGKVQFKGIETDLFQSGKWEALATYTFNDGSNAIPSDLPILKMDQNCVDNGTKAVGWNLCGIVVGLALGFSCWTFYNSKKQVVRSAQPIFLHTISAGTLLMGLSIIPLTIGLGVTDQKGADAACMAFPWLLTNGFSLTFSALFAKAYRINKKMKSANRFQRVKRVKIAAVDIMKPMTVLLMLNIIVLIVWTVIDPLQRKTVAVDQDAFLRDIETYCACTSKHMTIFHASLYVINLGSLIVASIQAQKTLKISTELQESRYIFLAITLILLVSFIAIPMVVIAEGKVAASYFVMAGFVFIASVSTLLLVFVPKVDAVRNQNRNTRGSRITKNISSTSSSAQDGIRIFNLQGNQAELEKEIRELRRLLSTRTPKLEGGLRLSSIGFNDDESRCSSIASDSAGEMEFPTRLHQLKQVQFEEDVESIPSTIYEVRSKFSSDHSENVPIRLLGAGHWVEASVMNASYG